MLASSSEQLQKVSWYLQLLQMGNHEKWIGLQFGQIVVAQVAASRTMNNQQINKFIGLVTHTLSYSLSLSFYHPSRELSITFNKLLTRKTKDINFIMNKKRILNAGVGHQSKRKRTGILSWPGSEKGWKGKENHI